MFTYILKRILIFIPTLIAISLLTFAISLSAPGDPVELMLGQAGGSEGQLADKMANEQSYADMRKKLRLDLPVFYGALSNAGSCDTLYRVPKKMHRDLLDRLTDQYGNWPQINTYFKLLKKLELDAYTLPKDEISQDALINIKNYISELYLNYDDRAITQSLDKLRTTMADINGKYRDLEKEQVNALVQLEAQKAQAQADSIAALSDPSAAAQTDSLATPTDSTTLADTPPTETTESLLSDIDAGKALNIAEKVNATLGALTGSYQTVKSEATPHKKYIPSLQWYGLNNQYHQWFTRFITGDFGYSYQDKRPIRSILFDRLKWTMLISILAIIITYLIAIPLGVFSAVKKGTFSDKFSTTILFVLYSLPSFWVATLLIMFFGGGDYWDWFPPYGVGNPAADASFMEVFKIRAYHLALPLLCWTYGTFAFLSRQMRGGMLSVLRQDYVRTARAKGLSEGTVIWKHAFRNSLIPIITIFANVFPLMISGSVILEVIFTIPGMGKWGFDGIIFRDYPVVFTVMMFSAILTMVGYLISDILYAIVDPRISYDK